MKTISSLRDLEDYGFKPLTGEACNLSMRMLVDLTEQGCKLFCECYGLPRVDKQFNENWNPGPVSVHLAIALPCNLSVSPCLEVSRGICVTVWRSSHGLMP